MKTSKTNCTGASDGKRIEHLLTQAQNLPRKLRNSGHFCVWRYELVRNRRAKVPYNPLTGCRADSSDINTFCSFEEAAEALHRGGYNGLGAGIFGTLAAIDIDHCHVNGELSEMAEKIVEMMDAYMEVSPSGEGIRILFLANHFEYDTRRYYINNQKLGLEVYVAGATNKYVTVTGDAPQLWQQDLMERGEQLKTVLERYMLRPASASAAMTLPHPGGAKPASGDRARFPASVRLSDEEVLEKARTAKNSAQFQALFNGDLSGYQSSSEADLALCNQLAFWCGGDTDQMDRLFRRSGLMREKWDRRQSGSTYGAITLMKASQSCQNVYAPALCAPSCSLDGLEPPPERGFAPLEQGPMETPPLDGLEPPPERGFAPLEQGPMETPPLDGLEPPPERSPDAMENPGQAPAEAPRQWRIPENIPRFDPVDARTLQGMDIKPLRFVVQGLLPEGLSMLASPPKYGKSWMMLDLGICVASGQPFLGRSTQSGRVLYLALEDSRRRLRERANRLLASETAPANLDLQIRARTLDDGLLEQMHQYMLDNPDTVLIIIDTFARVRGKSASEYSYNNDYFQMGRLKKFADYHHVALLLVHHLRKLRDEGDPFNQISGTNGIFGALDTAMVLTRDKRDDAVSALSVTGRDLDGFEEQLRFDKVSCHWETLGDAEAYRARSALEQFRHDPLTAAVQRLTAAHPRGWEGSSKELMNECARLMGRPPLENVGRCVSELDRLKKYLRDEEKIWVDTSRKKNNMRYIRIWKLETPEQSSMADRAG